MGSYCCYCDSGDLPSACYEIIERKARKTHICCECKSTIDPGEKYFIHSGIWDGEWDEFKICSFCEQVINAIIDECDLDGMNFGELWDCVSCDNPVVLAIARRDKQCLIKSQSNNSATR